MRVRLITVCLLLSIIAALDAQGPAPAISIPGPLRILVAIGSPDAQNARGELLDMESELQRILDATEKPHRAGKAFVHILEHGGTAAIHDELMHTVEAESAALAAAGSPYLGRFLKGIWAWMGGCKQWHATSARYHAAT